VELVAKKLTELLKGLEHTSVMLIVILNVIKFQGANQNIIIHAKSAEQQKREKRVILQNIVRNVIVIERKIILLIVLIVEKKCVLCRAARPEKIDVGRVGV